MVSGCIFAIWVMAEKSGTTFGSCQKKHDEMLLVWIRWWKLGFWPAVKLYVHLLVCTQKKKSPCQFDYIIDGTSELQRAVHVLDA